MATERAVLPEEAAAQEAFADTAARLQQDAAALLGRACRTGADYADLFFELSTHHRLALRQQVTPHGIGAPVREVVPSFPGGVALRVLRGTESAHLATRNTSPRALHQTAARVADRLRGPAGPRVLPPPPDVTPTVLPADAPEHTTLTEKSVLLEAAAEAAFSLDACVRRVEVDYFDRTRHVLVLTSEGSATTDATMLLGLRVAVTVETSAGLTTAHAVAGGAFGFGYFFTHPPEELAREAVRRALVLAEARPMPPCACPVVFAAGTASLWLHEAVGHLLEGDVALADHAPFQVPPGAQLAPHGITITDDPTLAGGRASMRTDDEATPAHPTPLIQEGRLATHLLDRLTGRVYGRPSTGNGRRQDYRFPPLPRMTNLLLLPGTEDPRALIADVQDGLLVQVAGQGRTVPADNRFELEVREGYRIEGGRIAAPVAGVCVRGYGPDVLRSLAVADDFRLDTARGHCVKGGQIVPVSTGSPTVLVPSLEVA